METSVVYHRDADGFCAAAIAKMAGIEGKYWAVDYGDKTSGVITGGKVYMLDYCLQPFERMETLNDMCELYWIDHHKSALDAALKANFKASGDQLTVIGGAACELTWLYFHPIETSPCWVHLTGRYDVWDHSDPHTIPFHYGLLSRELDPATSKGMSVWEALNDETEAPGTGLTIMDIVTGGQYIQRYNDIKYARLAKDISFELAFEGLKFIAFNRTKTGSKIADSVWDTEVYDAILTFGWARDQWVVGLYSDKPGIDVSAIAVKYGGGGHAGAAGFQCQELPFALGE